MRASLQLSIENEKLLEAATRQGGDAIREANIQIDINNELERLGITQDTAHGKVIADLTRQRDTEKNSIRDLTEELKKQQEAQHKQLEEAQKLFEETRTPGRKIRRGDRPPERAL